ncbi:hypothetical protein K439DRAFT_1632417 [Ramaria rubella]|nr:hypothetical protein K439DRAFT_1632417 [Ramaria rubella]
MNQTLISVALDEIKPGITRNKYAMACSLVVLLYDQALTFGDEVNYIWNYPRGPGPFVYLVLRYIAPPFLVINFLTLFPIWTLSVSTCQGMVGSGFPIFSVLIVLSLSSWIMILRTFALYGLNKRLLAFLAFLWGVGIAFMVFTVLYLGVPLNLPPELIVASKLCLLGHQVTASSSVFWAGPLLLDTVIIVLTIRKTGMYRKEVRWEGAATSMAVVKIYLIDGILYYFVVCLAHLLNLLLTVFAPDGFKNIAGSFSQTLTTLVVCRLVISLRKEKDRRSCMRTTYKTAQSVTNNRTWSDGMDITSFALASFFDIELNELDRAHAGQNSRHTGTINTQPRPPVSQRV